MPYYVMGSSGNRLANWLGATVWMLLALATGAWGGERMPVAVSVPPQAYVVEQIGGERVAVQVLLGQGQDPHTFAPSPRQVVALGRARVYFSAGLPFEKRLLAKLGGARNLVVADMGGGHGGAEHKHDEGEHAELDPHAWLALPQVVLMARRVGAVLSRTDPANRGYYEERLEDFVRRIEATQSRTEARLRPYRGRSFYVFHPAFGHFAETYGLRQEAVEIAGKSPTPKQLKALIEKARGDGVRAIFAQPQFDQRKARTIADAIGAKVLLLDPLARDVLANVEDIATKLEQNWRQP